MIFFDLDGTLIDHDAAVKEALNDLLQVNQVRSNLSISEIYHLWQEILERNYNLYLEGKLTHEAQRLNRITDFYATFGKKVTEAEAQKLLKYYIKSYEENWRLYDDVMPCLEELNNERLAIISNGYYHQQLDKLRKTGIHEYFEFVVTSSEFGKAKPERDIFEFACQKAKVKPKHALYIGDRYETDALGSYHANMIGIWLNRSSENSIEKSTLSTHEGVFVISSLRELQPLMATLPSS